MDFLVCILSLTALLLAVFANVRHKRQALTLAQLTERVAVLNQLQPKTYTDPKPFEHDLIGPSGHAFHGHSHVIKQPPGSLL